MFRRIILVAMVAILGVMIWMGGRDMMSIGRAQSGIARQQAVIDSLQTEKKTVDEEANAVGHEMATLSDSLKAARMGIAMEKAKLHRIEKLRLRNAETRTGVRRPGGT